MQVLVLAVEDEFTSLVVHRRPRCDYAGVSLRCERDNFPVQDTAYLQRSPP
jgi:hypothetical protein